MTTKQPHGRLFELNISFLLRTSYRFPNGEHPIVLRLKYRGAKKDVFIIEFSNLINSNNTLMIKLFFKNFPK